MSGRESMTNFLVFAGSFLVTSALLGQAAAHANERYKTEEGRSAVAQTLVAEGREKEQRPKELLNEIGIKANMVIADVGTGAGFMLPYMSDMVGPKGKVYAEDIFPDFLAKAKKNAADHKLTNVEFVAGTERDPKLPANTFDRILIMDAYHHFDYPKEMLAVVTKALKPNGQLAIVEYHKARFAGGDEKHVRFESDELVKEIEGYGFSKVSQKDFIPKIQYITLFKKK
jgi:ubiquinone/menaquinone biosynthesis C-methylase UbiE